MTNEEAIRLLRRSDCNGCKYLIACTRDGDGLCSKASEMGAKALEKQIPKRPKITFKWTEPSLPVVRCPECAEPLLGYKVYCSNCGQKIDRSDEDAEIH